jgi:hypothetical protein
MDRHEYKDNDTHDSQRDTVRSYTYNQQAKRNGMRKWDSVLLEHQCRENQAH